MSAAPEQQQQNGERKHKRKADDAKDSKEGETPSTKEEEKSLKKVKRADEPPPFHLDMSNARMVHLITCLCEHPVCIPSSASLLREARGFRAGSDFQLAIRHLWVRRPIQQTYAILYYSGHFEENGIDAAFPTGDTALLEAIQFVSDVQPHPSPCPPQRERH
jgi:hypothetical protein